MARASSVTATDAIAFATSPSSGLPAACDAAIATEASAAASPDGRATSRCATGIRRSSSATCTTLTASPFLVAWRRRLASSGCSLRIVEPTRRTACCAPTSAIFMPSHGAPAKRARESSARKW